jgi:hypothetical protein
MLETDTEEGSSTLLRNTDDQLPYYSVRAVRREVTRVFPCLGLWYNARIVNVGFMVNGVTRRQVIPNHLQ